VGRVNPARGSDALFLALRLVFGCA
jgi:hypothetical protein